MEEKRNKISQIGKNIEVKDLNEDSDYSDKNNSFHYPMLDCRDPSHLTIYVSEYQVFQSTSKEGGSKDPLITPPMPPTPPPSIASNSINEFPVITLRVMLLGRKNSGKSSFLNTFASFVLGKPYSKLEVIKKGKVAITEFSRKDNIEKIEYRYEFYEIQGNSGKGVDWYNSAVNLLKEKDEESYDQLINRPPFPCAMTTSISQFNRSV